MRRLCAALASVLLLAAVVPAAADAVRPLGPDWRRGVDVTAYWWQDLDGPKLTAQLKRARDVLGATEVTYVLPWYQWFSGRSRTDDLNAVTIRPAFGSASRCKGQTGRDWTRCKTPSDASVRRAIRLARSLGLRVALRPQLEVGKTARRAQPRDLVDKGADQRQPWFDSYKRMVSRYARIAREERAQTLVLGAGLSGMTNDEADRAAWRSMAAEVRDGRITGDGRGFTGELTYAAAWDSILSDVQDPASQPFFWDALDVIGVDAQFPIAAGDMPSAQQLLAGWTTSPLGMPIAPVAQLRALATEYAKPVLVTTLGYLSRRGTASFPEKDDAAQAKAGGRVSADAQRRAVGAALEALSAVQAEGWLKGVWWYEWPATGRRAKGDGSFSLQGKPAERTIAAWHKAR